MSTSEGSNKSKKWRVPFFETSAKTAKNVQEMFHQIVREIKTFVQVDEAPKKKKKKKGSVIY